MAFALIVIFAPLMLLIALAIKCTSKGPIIYRQERLGLHGKTFVLLKFRGLKKDAPRCFLRLSRRDPRITWVGRIIRPAHLDELPQLINIIRGEMSLVGPRPFALDRAQELKQLIPDFEKRLAVKPGLTGMAQVGLCKSYDHEASQRYFQLDLQYMEVASFWTDIKIVARTVPHMFSLRSF